MAPGGIQLASGSSGFPLAAVNATGLTIYPVSSMRTGDFALLISNALRFVGAN